MKTDLLVDSAEFLARVREDLAGARESAYVQANTFEGDSAGKAVAELIRASPARDRRVLVDSYTRHVMSDRFRWNPWNHLDPVFRAEVRDTFSMFEGLQRQGVGVRFTNPVGALLFRFPGRNHKKVVVVDGRVSYIGGICFSDHNFAWHDAMLRIEDDRAAAFLHQDFLATWEGRHRGASLRLPGLAIHALDGASNELPFAEVLELIDGARESLFMEVPYLSTPFAERLREAQKRGVRVVLVTPKSNNWALPGAVVRREAARSGFEVRRLDRGMTHMKAALIDERVLVIGSANFETFSYRTQQEYLCITTEEALVADFRARVAETDVRLSTPSVETMGPVAAFATDVLGTAVDRAMVLWKRLATVPSAWEEHAWEERSPVPRMAIRRRPVIAGSAVVG
jgi:cardiolipin synthase